VVVAVDGLRADTQLTLDEPGRVTRGGACCPCSVCVLFCARFALDDLGGPFSSHWHTLCGVLAVLWLALAPAGATHPLYTSEKLKDGANNKWDASRQMRFKHSNPNGLPADAFSQPAPLITVTAFPTDPVEGNDDSSTGDEVPMPGGTAPGNANDPYQATSQGVLWSTDVPTFAISKGNLGETFEFNLQLQEFPPP
jgi:hypothetical protein